MDLRSIIAVPGMAGLFKVLSQAKSGVIVEALTDKKRTMLSAAHRISSLDNISVFTSDKDVSLEDVLLKMKEKISEPVNTKADAQELKEKFKTILPDFDQQRVHDSDIKKMFVWFNLLKDIPEVWAEKKPDDDSKVPVVPGGAEKPQHFAPKESGKVKTHAAAARSVIPQKKGSS